MADERTGRHGRYSSFYEHPVSEVGVVIIMMMSIWT